MDANRAIYLWESSGARERGIRFADFRTEHEQWDDSPRIGFCTTVRGPERFPLLLESLKHNLEVFDQLWKEQHFKPKAHFVVLGYGEPELEAFMRTHFREEMERGIVVLANTEAECFEYASAKNTAARVAMDYLDCNVVCNLDCDNKIGEGGNVWNKNEEVPDFITFLQRVFHRNPYSIVRPVHDNGDDIGMPIMRGIGGRIAISAENFMYMRGYDEQNYAHWGGDDRDFTYRALSMHPVSHNFLTLVPVTDPLIAGDVIDHDPQFRWQNLAPEWQSLSEETERQSTLAWNTPIKRTPEMAVELSNLLDDPSNNPVIYANPAGWKKEAVAIAYYDAAREEPEFKTFALKPLPKLTEREKYLQSKFSPEAVREKRERASNVFTKAIINGLRDISPFVQEAILFAAEKERKFGGHEPIDRIILKLIGQVKHDAYACERITQGYQRYLDTKAHYLPSCPEKQHSSFTEKHSPGKGLER